MSNGAPADWLTDPTGRHQLRYWDGAIWTDHVADNGTQSSDPVEVSTDEALIDAVAFSMNPSDTVVVWEGEKKNSFAGPRALGGSNSNQ